MKRVIFALLFLLILGGLSCESVFAQDSSYYFRYSNDGENNVEFEIYKNDNSLNEVFDNLNFENLEFFPLKTDMFIFFPLDNDNMKSVDNEIYLSLLRQGYVRIVDESIATQEEIDAQEKAKDQHLGGWEIELVNENGEKESVWRSWWNKIVEFLGENYQFIVSTMAGCGLLAYIAKKIYKLLHTRKKVVLLGGANASGKTTLRNSMMNPDASIDDLINSSPTLKVVKERVIRDDTNHKVLLSASIIDPPGHELSHSIDCLSKYNEIFLAKYVVIIILAPCKGYSKEQAEYSHQYINDQCETINKLWIPLLQANSTIYPEQVILFINKKDLFKDDKNFDLCFKKQEEILNQVCKRLGITFNVIKGSILRKAGITELMRLLRK